MNFDSVKHKPIELKISKNVQKEDSTFVKEAVDIIKNKENKKYNNDNKFDL